MFICDTWKCPFVTSSHSTISWGLCREFPWIVYGCGLNLTPYTFLLMVSALETSMMLEVRQLCLLNVKALEVIKSALRDGWVRMGRRYSLLQRAQKICQSTAVKKSSQRLDLWQNFAGDYMNEVSEPRSVTIIVLLTYWFIFLLNSSFHNLY